MFTKKSNADTAGPDPLLGVILKHVHLWRDGGGWKCRTKQVHEARDGWLCVKDEVINLHMPCVYNLLIYNCCLVIICGGRGSLVLFTLIGLY